MYAIELYVPQYDNQGNEISMGYWAELEHRITHAFNGFTRYATSGSWKGQEKAVTVYRIISKEIVSKRAIREIAEYVKRAWIQKSVLYTVQALVAVEYV